LKKKGNKEIRQGMRYTRRGRGCRKQEMEKKTKEVNKRQGKR
jgi:hypothetical protein